MLRKTEEIMTIHMRKKNSCEFFIQVKTIKIVKPPPLGLDDLSLVFVLM